MTTWVGLAIGELFLIERRGQTETPDPKRQVELATLLDSLPEAVFLYDTNSNVVDANATAEQFADLKADELHGMNDDALTRRLLGKDDQGRTLEEGNSVVAQSLRGEVVRQIRRLYQHPRDGREIEALVSASPMCNKATGEIVGALVMVRDITELSQLHRRLADTQKHSAVGQMAAGIAHDFNNVLDSISQAVFLLETQADKAAAERKIYTDLIVKAVRRGAEISERVREYLRTGTGERSPVDLRQLMDEVVEMTRPMWQMSRKVGVRIHFGPVPKVYANAADMRRVFTNLIINALEAMPRGGALTLGCEEVNGMVRVTVEDTGEGIKPEERSKMFVPYFTTKKTGTGLGLSGAQKIVTSEGGKIWFTSQPGKGTCFIIEMPAAARSNRAEDKRDQRQAKKEDGDKPAGNRVQGGA